MQSGPWISDFLIKMLQAFFISLTGATCHSHTRLPLPDMIAHIILREGTNYVAIQEIPLSFMETEVSLQCSQEPTKSSDPEPYVSTPHTTFHPISLRSILI